MNDALIVHRCGDCGELGGYTSVAVRAALFPCAVHGNEPCSDPAPLYAAMTAKDVEAIERHTRRGILRGDLVYAVSMAERHATPGELVPYLQRLVVQLDAALTEPGE